MDCECKPQNIFLRCCFPVGKYSLIDIDYDYFNDNCFVQVKTVSPAKHYIFVPYDMKQQILDPETISFNVSYHLENPIRWYMNK